MGSAPLYGACMGPGPLYGVSMGSAALYWARTPVWGLNRIWTLLQALFEVCTCYRPLMGPAPLYGV